MGSPGSRSLLLSIEKFFAQYLSYEWPILMKLGVKLLCMETEIGIAYWVTRVKIKVVFFHKIEKCQEWRKTVKSCMYIAWWRQTLWLHMGSVGSRLKSLLVNIRKWFLPSNELGVTMNLGVHVFVACTETKWRIAHGITRIKVKVTETKYRKMVSPQEWNITM